MYLYDMYILERFLIKYSVQLILEKVNQDTY